MGRAIEQYEQALVINREIGDRRGEGDRLGNLGNAYAALGQVGRAIEQYEQALVISREIGDRYNESLTLAYDGFVSLDAGNAPVARERFSLARAIAIEIDNAECRSEAAYGLALAHLLAGDLVEARAMIEEAAAVPYPLHGPRVAALQGIIALRQGDSAAAAMAFDAAAEKARQFLASTPDLVAARDSLGLATAGLALLAAGEADARGLAAEAAAAYRAARAVTSAAGVTGRAVRLLDALAVADAQGLLKPVRSAAAGEAAIAS